MPSQNKKREIWSGDFDERPGHGGVKAAAMSERDKQLIRNRTAGFLIFTAQADQPMAWHTATHHGA